MERIYIKDLGKHKGEEVKISGYVDVRRDQGKMVFFDFRDLSGKVQGITLPNSKALDVAKEVKNEFVVSVVGKVNERPENAKKEGILNGDIELEVLDIEIISNSEIPFELNEDVNIDTYLDNQPFLLRDEKHKAVFKIQSVIIQAYREFLVSEGFTEFQAPKLTGGDAEGGAGVFEVKYFDSKAYLATSPQLYKQMMVGVFERVFTTGNVYRAEKHSTTRHTNEYTSLDFEMGFIESHLDIMKMENKALKFISNKLKESVSKEVELIGSSIPEVPEEIPYMKLKEAQELILKETGENVVGEPDLEPQHERWLCQYAKDNLNSEFIFITHYPVSKRPFYTLEDDDDKGFTKSFDLLFRGVEITTGGQRVHQYEEMVEKMKAKGLDPEKFSFYLQAFKTGMPTHGGIGMGLERLTQKICGLENIKEATLFPREINRIDTLLNKS